MNMIEQAYIFDKNLDPGLASYLESKISSLITKLIISNLQDIF